MIDELEEVLPQRYRLVRGLRINRLRQEPLLRALAGCTAHRCSILEALAAHRGSVLGNLPDAPQPGAEDV